MRSFMLGAATILDNQAPEYLWLESQSNRAIPRQDLIQLIIQCFGGDEQIASRMLDVVERKLSRFEFLEYCKSTPYFIQH